MEVTPKVSSRNNPNVADDITSKYAEAKKRALKYLRTVINNALFEF